MFISSRSHSIHVLLDGSEELPPLLLLHSLGTNLHIWDPQVAVLRHRFRCVRIDMRGHGLSGMPPGPASMEDLARDALDVMDRLGLETFAVGGVSIGGMIAQALAVLAPTRIAGLLLVDTSMVTAAPAMWHDRARTVRAEGLVSIADTVMARWNTAAFACEEAVQGLRTMLLRTDPEGFAVCGLAIAGADYRSALVPLGVPVLVIVGAEDQSTPVKDTEALAAALGGSVRIIEGAAHIPNFEQAEALAAAMGELP